MTRSSVLIRLVTVSSGALGLVALSAAPALAQTTLAVPSPSPYTSYTDATVSAHSDCVSSLKVRLPDGTTVLGSNSNAAGSHTYVVRPTDANGTYTASITDGGCVVHPIQGSKSQSFTVRIAPAAPSGLTAVLSGPHQITLSWQPNPEADIASYDVLTGDGQPLLPGLPPAKVCTGDGCSATLDYPESVSGEQTYVLRANRHTAPGSSDTLASADSAPASATIPVQPTPTPSSTTSGAPGSPAPGPSGSPAAPGTGGGAGGTGGAGGSGPTGGTGTAASHTFRLGFSTSGGGLTAAPTLPGGGAPAPVTEPTAEGTYRAQLNYGDKVVREKVPAASGGGLTFDNAVNTVADLPRLLRALAAALLLVLGAAHLRVWLSRPVE